MSIFPTRILLATDGSPHAQLAALKAVELAKCTGARLHVVAVGRTFPQAVYELYTETEEGRQALRRETQEVLDGQENRRGGRHRSYRPLYRPVEDGRTTR